MRAAVFGDVHGRQDLMYKAALEWQERNENTIDVILQVGDFETIVCAADFEHYYAPRKYHRISDVADYCKGLRRVPFLTVFTGGNHEAWSVLAPNNDGGFICPDVYYLGRAGTFTVKGVTIAGLTGVYHPEKYLMPLSERPEYDWKFYRGCDVELLRQKRFDVLLLHDWLKPLDGIKFEKQVVPEEFNHPNITPTRQLIEECRPQYAFMGHIHEHYFSGLMGPTRVQALSQFKGNGEQHSFTVVEVTPSRQESQRACTQQL